MFSRKEIVSYRKGSQRAVLPKECVLQACYWELGVGESGVNMS